MADSTLSVYESAEWGARIAGVAHAHRDDAGTLFMDEVRVVAVRVSGHFSVLSCVDGSTRVVLTSFLRLVRGASHSDQPALG
jgi:hypothetical protein